MIQESSEHSEVYNHLLKLSTPSEEDFKRVFTEEELKELCLKHKVKVNMWKWNIVDEYRIIFTETGRFQRWSTRERLGMLAKAVNKMKPSVLYADEEIIKIRKREWEEQLKENILSLNFWKKQRLGNPRLQIAESEDVGRESLYEVHTESMNPEELLTQSEARDSQMENIPTYFRSSQQEVQLEIEVVTEFQNQETLATSSESEIDIISTEELSRDGRPTANGEAAATENVEISKENVLAGALRYIDFDVDGDSEDSVDMELFHENEKKQIADTLKSEEIAPEIQNILNVNTGSMTIDSQMCTQSQDLPMLQSQDVLPQNYENFVNIIPLTSTQSQNHESEDVS